MNEPSLLREPTPEQSELLVTSLNVMAALSAAVGTLAAAGALSQAALTRALDLELILLCAGWLVAGCAIGCALWAISWIIRLLGSRAGNAGELPAELAHLPRLDELASMTASETAKRDSASRRHVLLQRIADELSALREDMSLSPEQRAARAEQRRTEQLAQEMAQIHSAIAAGEFVLAEERIEHLAKTTPDAPDLDGARTELTDARAAAEARKLARARATVGELMSMAAFDEAIAAADHLARQLPDSDQATELLAHVRREADTFAAQQRQKLYMQVARATEMHHWRDALAAARQLALTYPASAEAGEVVAQMDLLTENARIEEVRDRRDRIAELLQRHRYRLAVELAEDVVAHYPDTQAAKELAGQMDRLRELAAKDKSS